MKMTDSNKLAELLFEAEKVLAPITQVCPRQASNQIFAKGVSPES